MGDLYKFAQGQEMVKATPMTEQEFHTYMGWGHLPKDRAGYMVERIEENSMPNHKDHTHPIEWRMSSLFHKLFIKL